MAEFVAQFRGPDNVDVVLSGNDLAYSLKDPVVELEVIQASN